MIDMIYSYQAVFRGSREQPEAFSGFKLPYGFVTTYMDMEPVGMIALPFRKTCFINIPKERKQKKHMKKLISILLALTLSLTLFVSVASADGNAKANPIPDFTVTDSDGITFTLSEALKDHKAVLVNFWATWCGWCVYEFPYLNEVYHEYKDRVAFIALTTGKSDTVEVINDFRKQNGFFFPMGRDENAKLADSVNSEGLPTTIVIDRFGNLVFNHAGAFHSADEFRRVLDVFISDNYTESTVLKAIPKESTTKTFHVSERRALIVENEDAQKVVFRGDNYPFDIPCWIVPEKTASLRVEICASDNPGALMYREQNEGILSPLGKLLDPERNVFTCEISVPLPEDDMFFNYAFVSNPDLEEDPNDAEIFVISSEDCLEDLKEYLELVGLENVSWTREEAVPVKASEKEKAYILRVIDQDGNPVPEVTVSFCTDEACVPCESDESGIITFTGKPFAYHVQVVDVPEGYSTDDGFEMTTTEEYGEWLLRIRKN